MDKVKVFIDPRSRILYSSFYIKGLHDLFGKKNVFFSSRCFSDLNRKNETHSFDHYLALVFHYPNRTLFKLIIDFRDKPSVKENAYNWCDKYAKINYNPELTDPKFIDKMISIPPGFGIKIWNFWITAYYCICNLIRVNFSPLVSIKHFVGDYYAQWKRQKIGDYLKEDEKNVTSTEKPYVFMVATLWNNLSERVNSHRKQFIEACKNSKCNFEGGFYSSNNSKKNIQDNVFNKKISTKEYVIKTKSSAFVFNTAAVHNCHGWKLGEFLAMGKAIISTPITNALPEKLTHGKNIHIISDLNDLSNAVNLLINDFQYRKILENGAKEYYISYADPKRVIENILSISSLTYPLKKYQENTVKYSPD
jgi:glycosyltransferase involved in cell wall biosynthesis